jgi:diamine N-acetyltransferase
MGTAPVQQLVGRFTRLEPVVAADVDFLYKVTTAPEISYRWRYRGEIPSEETFAQQLLQTSSPQFTVWLKDKSQRIGHVITHDMNLRDRTTYIGTVIAPGLVGEGLAVDATAAFIDFLFRAWDLRKIYGHTPTFNLPDFKSAMGRGIVEEGRLGQHLYADGKYWDVHILALYRETWAAPDARQQSRLETSARIREWVSGNLPHNSDSAAAGLGDVGGG